MVDFTENTILVGANVVLRSSFHSVIEKKVCIIMFCLYVQKMQKGNIQDLFLFVIKLSRKFLIYWVDFTNFRVHIYDVKSVVAYHLPWAKESLAHTYIFWDDIAVPIFSNNLCYSFVELDGRGNARFYGLVQYI
jgi:hypothetical protein